MRQFILTILCVTSFVKIYALDGYLTTIYSGALRDSYGECIHLSYYDANSDDNKECQAGNHQADN